MISVAPNLVALFGVQIAIQLVSHAGSISTLVKASASKIHILFRLALRDLADATELFYLVWKAITSVKITSASFFIISSNVILSISNLTCNNAR
ncbi:MAG: hypothetical protein EZS28_042937, partial [Streblomastix strix]